MAALFLTVQGLRIHAGFYRRSGDWRLDPVDTYVVDADGRLVWEIDDTDRLGELDAEGRFRSLRCLAETAVNDDVAADWDGKQTESVGIRAPDCTQQERPLAEDACRTV
ncbi:MAG TPA: hypothetical protein VM639_15050 [Dongiaceae bacterium]|nr:hypothetical protein [Dongiaceae bacterium]